MGLIDGELDLTERPVAGPLLALGRRALTWQTAGFLSLLLAAYLLVSVITLTGHEGVYSSPDETGNYIIAKAFGETGKLYYTRDYFAADQERLAHPRSLLRYEDRVVLPNAQGLPLTYGAGYALFGDHVTLIALLLSPLCLFFAYETVALVLRRRSLLLAAAFFGMGPLLYWFSRPYWNSLGATTFFVGGVYFLARYHAAQRRTALVWSALLFCASMLFRYEYVVFVAPLAAIVLGQRYGRAAWRTGARELVLFGAICVAAFLLPVIGLSLFVYERPLVFPTALLEKSVASEASPYSFVQALRLGWNAVLPEGFDPLLVARNLVRLTIMLVPALTLLSLGGVALALRRRAIGPWQIALFGGLLVYYLIFVGSVSSTYLATGWRPSFEASIVRYWLLLYLVMYGFACYLIVHAPGLARAAWPRLPERVAEALPALLVAALVCTTVPMVWFSFRGNLNQVRDGRAFGETWLDRVVDATEPNGVVYATGNLHKFFASERDPVIYPTSADEVAASSATSLAQHMARVLEYRPVYVIDSGIRLSTLELYLEDAGLRLERVGDGPILRVVPE